MSLRTVAVPAAEAALDLGVAVLGLVGLLLVRHGRWALPPGGPAKLNLATLAFVVGAGAVVLRVLLGVAAGITVVPELRFERGILDLIAVVGLGLFPFWILDAARLLGPQVLGIVALVLGGVGSVVVGFAHTFPRRVIGFEAVAGQGTLLELLAAVFWLAADVWGLGILRAGRLGRAPSEMPAQDTNR